MTATTLTGPPDRRTYGGWRLPRSSGLGSLGLLATVVLFAGLIVAIFVTAFAGFLAAIPVVLATGLILVPLYVKVGNGRNGAQWLTARTAWFVGQHAGQHLYRSGPLARVGQGRCPLPGLAASLEAIDALDALGRPFALLSHPLGHVSAVISTSSDGASLVDDDQVDQWVASWGAWLANLSHEPGLVACQVVIESAPDHGTRLRREVADHLAVDAPQLARDVLNECVDTYPMGGATITCRVGLTWSRLPRTRTGQKRRTVEEMAIDVGQRLPGLTTGLGAAGAGPARPMVAAEIAAACRVAYDPAIGADLELIGSAEADIAWQDCGPLATEEHWDRYRHDSGMSTSWQMVEAGRAAVFAGRLARLLAPHPDVARKRVALLFRPHSPAEATKVVERDRRDALFAAQSRKVGRARDTFEVRAAEQAANEEAAGAGLLRVGMVVTATVTDPDKLDAAITAVDNAATTSRLRLRRASGSQASSFIAALPLGMVLPEHLNVPAIVREAM